MRLSLVERILSVSVVVGATMFFAGSNLSGVLFPVMKHPAVISTMLEYTPASTNISGHSYRIRDCDFRSLEWFFGTRKSGRAAGVKVDFLESPKIRPTGRMDFGPWIIHVPISVLTSNTFADSLHQCYIYRKEIGRDENDDPIYAWPIIEFPWKTRSKFY